GLADPCRDCGLLVARQSPHGEAAPPVLVHGAQSFRMPGSVLLGASVDALLSIYPSWISRVALVASMTNHTVLPVSVNWVPQSSAIASTIARPRPFSSSGPAHLICGAAMLGSVASMRKRSGCSRMARTVMGSPTWSTTFVTSSL